MMKLSEVDRLVILTLICGFVAGFIVGVVRAY
jgi:hypothetical protein